MGMLQGRIERKHVLLIMSICKKYNSRHSDCSLGDPSPSILKGSLVLYRLNYDNKTKLNTVTRKEKFLVSES